MKDDNYHVFHKRSSIFQQTGHLFPTAFELMISISFSKLLSFEIEAEDVMQISEKSWF